MIGHLKTLFGIALLFVPGIYSQTGQQVALASYINPGTQEELIPGTATPVWNRLINYPQEKLSVLVANVANGPDNVADPGWQDVTSRASASGKTVLGYVRTGYFSRSVQNYTTRLGSTNIADWVAQIEEDVDMWYNLYGSSIGGIFFDEGLNECGSSSGSNDYVDIYTHINRYTKARHPGAFTVLNPGTRVPQCFEHAVDTLLTFEGPYTTYINSYVGNDWAPSDIRKIWHIVYEAPEAQVTSVAALALQRGAGLIEITDDNGENGNNPYDNLPSDSYMQTELNSVDGGDPLVETAPYPSGPAASTPTGLQVTASDYSSAHLTWTPAANAIGYQVYLNDNLVASVTSAMTAVTIGGLAQGTTYTVSVAALGGGGVESGRSNSATFTTQNLPNGKSVINLVSTPSPTSTTITADVLLPYGFVRIFIYDSVNCRWQETPTAWPIAYDGATYVCTRYMVENDKLYRYSAPPSTAPNAEFIWTQIGQVGIGRDGYHYTWTLPIGTNTIDTSKFLIQVQGYNPLQNVFQPDPPTA